MKLKGIKSVASIGIAVVLLITSAFAVAAANGRGEANYVARLEMRSFADGLSIDEVKEIRADVLARGKGLLLSARGEAPFALADPVIPDGAVVVAFGYVVRPDGVPSQYVAMAGCEDSVSPVHKQAREWLRSEKRGEDPSKRGPQGSITGEVGITATAGWTRLAYKTQTWARNPEGQATNHGAIYRLSNDGSASHNFYAVRQWATTTPGIVAYNSNWRNDRQIPRHDWGWGQLGAEMIDRDPLGSIIGSQTIGVSLTGGKTGAQATLSWSYIQPAVTTHDTSILVPPLARWEQHFNTATARNTSGGMEPGSAVRTLHPARGTYRLLRQINEVRYSDPHWWGSNSFTVTLTINWSITY